ncbi:MAG TPA: enoyl-CoA hydratase, partial [Phenylobacterium sp.]|nr:enoyl-CoA hydratase [Phenylobacterium sp.]
MAAAERTPVIVGVGDLADRPTKVEDAREPLRLMADALRAADLDAGGGWLARLDLLSLVGLVSWRYRDPAGQLCDELGIAPGRKVNASMGGETPIRLIHEAAVAIARGELRAAAVVGGEASHARSRAQRDGVELPWTPLPPPGEAARFPSSSFALSPVARQLGVRDPSQIYPFYEMATQAAWGLTPQAGEAESASLWARYAAVAAENPNAWVRGAPSPEAIAAVGPDNRMINWPYPKLMNANPSVNQAAAVIVTSLAEARAAGVPDERLVHIWGGAAAVEPEDYLLRDRYDRSTAQAATLGKAVEIAGGDVGALRWLELYSCFPVVPKMALRSLGLDGEAPAPTV